jgi:hypothetical protein
MTSIKPACALKATLDLLEGLHALDTPEWNPIKDALQVTPCP